MDKKRKDITEENNKDFIKDGMTSDEIRKTIKAIRLYMEKGGNVSMEDRIKMLELDHEFFFKRYPVLFDLATRDTFNNDYLEYFLNMRDKIASDKLSSDEASKIVGQEWFNKFVDVSKMNSSEKK